MSDKTHSDKKNKTHLTDTESRIVRQGAIRSATRWLQWMDYIMRVDHLPTRLLQVIDRYGYGGCSMKDIRFFTTDSVPLVNSVIDSLVEKKSIKLVRRGGGQRKYVSKGRSYKTHSRINSQINV